MCSYSLPIKTLLRLPFSLWMRYKVLKMLHEASLWAGYPLLILLVSFPASPALLFFHIPTNMHLVHVELFSDPLGFLSPQKYFAHHLILLKTFSLFSHPFHLDKLYLSLIYHLRPNVIWIEWDKLSWVMKLTFMSIHDIQVCFTHWLSNYYIWGQ